MNFNHETKFDSVGEDFEMVEFSWKVTNYCNYDCSYCYAKTFMAETLDTDTSYKLILQKLKMCQVTFDITLVGGEPTRHPELEYIVSELYKIKKCRVLELYTNFTESVEYYHNLQNKKLSLKLSYHPEYHRAFVNKLLQAIYENKTDFLVLVNLSPDSKFWDKTQEVLKICKEYHIKFEINYLSDTDLEYIEYTNEFYNMFDCYITDNMNSNVEHVVDGVSYQIPESQIFRNKLTYKDMKCIPRMFRIEQNGDFINSCSGRKLPIIIKAEDINQTFLCPHNQCSCSAMLPFKKEKN